jgi:hypothetical protein
VDDIPYSNSVDNWIRPQKTDMTVYLIGSLRNPYVPVLGEYLRENGISVFDDWHAPGPETDEFWQAYEQGRKKTFQEALNGWHAWHVFEYDRTHLDRCDAGVLVLPAGKSAHLELGYMKGLGKPTYVLFDQEPERWDVMYRFACAVCMNRAELLEHLKRI